MVLASPGLDSTLAGWKQRLAPVLARVWPTAALPNDVDGNTLSRDPGVGAAVARDPLCATHSTARFGAAGLAEQARVRARASRGLGVPTLVLHGEDDGLVPVSASLALPARRRPPAAPSPACGTSCTTSRKVRRCSTRWSSGCGQPVGGDAFSGAIRPFTARVAPFIGSRMHPSSPLCYT